MPNFDLPLPLANSIYNLSFTVLIGGTALVFLSAVGMIWSGLVKERHATEKAASIEEVTAQAKVSVDKAKADLAEANRQLASANAAAAAAQKEASDVRLVPEKPVAPDSGREVTSAQSDLFRNFTQNFSKGKVLVGCVPANPEAARFSGQISDMLKNAGYIVEDKPPSAAPIGSSSTGVQMKIKSMVEQPLYAGSLQRGLEFIGIDTTGELGDDAEDAVLIYVGNKP